MAEVIEFTGKLLEVKELSKELSVATFETELGNFNVMITKYAYQDYFNGVDGTLLQVGSTWQVELYERWLADFKITYFRLKSASLVKNVEESEPTTETPKPEEDKQGDFEAAKKELQQPADEPTQEESSTQTEKESTTEKPEEDTQPAEDEESATTQEEDDSTEEEQSQVEMQPTESDDDFNPEDVNLDNYTSITGNVDDDELDDEEDEGVAKMQRSTDYMNTFNLAVAQQQSTAEDEVTDEVKDLGNKQSIADDYDDEEDEEMADDVDRKLL